MYKVFLVDDEIKARESIRRSFLWDESGFEFAGEASDGEIALSMIEDIKPDILITDIRMPYMDGMELCRQVSRAMPWISIIILSGCDDFRCAREAISLGVKEYLLKPVSGQELLAALQRVAAQIREERRRQDNLNTFQNQLAASGRYFREKLLIDLCEGGDCEEIVRNARAMQMNLCANHYLVMLLEPAEKNISIKAVRCVRNVLEELSDAGGGAIRFARVYDGFLLLVMGDDESDLKSRADALAHAAILEAERRIGVKLLTATGCGTDEISELPASLEDARQIMKSLRNPTVESEPQQNIRIQDVPQDALMRLIDPTFIPLDEHLRRASLDDIDALLGHYSEILDGEAAQNAMMANYIYMEIMIAASKIIRENGGDPKEILSAALHQQEKGNVILNASEVFPLCRGMLQRAIVFRDMQDSSRYGSVIRRAKAFIAEHYSDSGLTLHDVAAYVALSNNHFCTVFSQETGVTFSEYLTAVRIARAKELLSESPLRTSDIAYAVGYNDPHYFSYLFKKNTGLSPREFRKDDKIVD